MDPIDERLCPFLKLGRVAAVRDLGIQTYFLEIEDQSIHAEPFYVELRMERKRLGQLRGFRGRERDFCGGRRLCCPGDRICVGLGAGENAAAEGQKYREQQYGYSFHGYTSF